MKEIIHRYDNCLLCGSELQVKYYDGTSINGSLEKLEDKYHLRYNCKSKIHKVTFDSNFKIIENDGYPKTFLLVKHCGNCSSPDIVEAPFFSIEKLMRKAAMFYMFYVDNRKEQSISLIEELFRFKIDNMAYGWHSKINAKTKVWNSTMVVADSSKTFDSIFMQTLESNNYNKFEDTQQIIDKLSMYHTFS